MIENDNIACSICLEEILPVHKILHTSCLHTYHTNCLEKYIIYLRTNHKTIACPICRTNINNEPYATPPPSPESIIVTISTNTRPQTVRYLRNNNRQCQLSACQKSLLFSVSIIILVGIILLAFLLPIYIL